MSTRLPPNKPSPHQPAAGSGLLSELQFSLRTECAYPPISPPAPLRTSLSHFSLLTSLPSLPEAGLHRHPSSESEMALLKGSTGLLWNDREFRGQSGRRDFLQEGIAARNFLRRRNFSYSQAFWPKISYRRFREAGKDEPHTRGEWRLRGRRLPHRRERGTAAFASREKARPGFGGRG